MHSGYTTWWRVEGLCWALATRRHSQKAAATPPIFVKSLVQSCRSPVKIAAVADIFGSVYDQCVDLLAGRAAEYILLEGEPRACR